MFLFHYCKELNHQSFDEKISKEELNNLLQKFLLKKKGLIKIKNFKKSENKLKYAYILTPAGFSAKVKLTLSFMKRKMKEYDYLKSQLKKSKKEKKK